MMRYVFNLGVADSAEPQWPKGGNEKGLPRNTVVTGIKKLFRRKCEAAHECPAVMYTNVTLRFYCR